MNQQPEYLYENIRFGQKVSPRQPRFEGYTEQSLYIPMRDGVRLAVDVFLPENLPQGEKLPALLYRTRYWRDAELKQPSGQPDPILSFFTSYGYAVLRMDVRGTGASFGSMIHEWQPVDIDDTYDIVEWILVQRWSNGKVGSYGVSYPGTTAELLAATKHPAVTSIWATYHELDGYTDIAFPGGVPSKFIPAWGEMTAALDRNQYPGESPNVIGVKPVDSDPEKILLEKAVAEHSRNHHVHELTAGLKFKDERMNIIQATFEDMMVYPRRPAIEASGAPLDIWGSWMDANTADTVIRHFTTFKNPLRGVISVWSHGGSTFHSPYASPGTALEIDRPTQMQEILRYMDQHFQGIDSGLPERILFYYTMGAETWKSTTVWPLPNTQTVKWYLCEDNALSLQPAANAGTDRYQVDFDVTTGEQNRWWTEMGGGPIVYSDRAEADKRLLVYDSPPLEADTEISGYPVVTLHITSTAEDGAFFVYLEDIDPQGKVTYITEGMLRALHRKVSEEQPPYTVFGPYHTYKREDAAPLVPGEMAELRFALMPTSVLVRKGHRIRVAIAGADKDTFERVPERGETLAHVHHGGAYASTIELPVIRG